jgi:hypothetical protein
MDKITFLESVIARLESKVDLLEAELAYLNALLRNAGFPKGTETLKEIFSDLLNEGEDLK